VSKQRIEICEGCEWHSSKHKTLRKDKHCVNCGCPLSKKTKCLSCSCPDNKWGAVVTEEQQAEMEENGKQ
jgi:uncharacterized Zn finger protein (UPF0148 family)